MAEAQETIVREVIEPKQTVLQKMQQVQEHEVVINNDSQVLQQKGVSKSQSSNSLHNVNLKESLLPDDVIVEMNKETANEEKISEDYFYEDDHEEVVHEQSPIPEFVVKLDGFYGHDSFKRYNAHVLDRDTIIMASGISYAVYNHFTRETKRFYSRDRGGIGAIAVHPSKKYYAVSEMGTWPNIYIYEYPSHRLYRVLRKGTERAYSGVCFSADGSQIASVGSSPDYLLTVWDWKQERLILKSKAFSQEVYKVTFNQFNQQWLTTSGTGHIRFWKISQTFTGLKLQGDIAKFGQFELSDVVSYAQFDDGNVLSSSEYGKLLLWEGNLIKSVVSRSVQSPCHNGAIEYVRLIDKKIITAGADGYIRFWDYQTINQGESDEKFNLYVQPEREIYFERNGYPSHLLWIVIEEGYWLIQDALGCIWKYLPDSDKRELLLEFNAGKFLDFAVSPLNNSVVTAGYDGYLRLWDYGNKREFYSIKYKTDGQSTCVEWLPFTKRNNGRTLVAGYSDGIVRFVGLDEKGFVLIEELKVHKNAVVKVKSNRDGSVVVALDSVGAMFFIAVSNVSQITPYCLFQTNFKINDLSWDRSGEKILLACQDGRLHEIDVPKEKDCDRSETYLKPHTFRSLIIKMMDSQKPNKEDLQLQLLLKKTKGKAVDEVVVDQEWDPAPIMNATYFSSDSSKILCSVQGMFLGYYYIVDFAKERPIGAIQAAKQKTSYLHYSQTNDVICVGFRNGTWDIRHKYDSRQYLRKHSFDQNTGVVRKVGMNVENTSIIAVSEDGTMLVHKFDIGAFLKGVKGETIDKVQVSIPAIILGISASTYSDKVDFNAKLPTINDNTMYCLQDQKLLAQENMKISEAEKIKTKKIKKIQQLRELFNEVVQINNAENDSFAKLSPEQMIVDPQYVIALQKRMEQDVEETKKQMMWDEYYAMQTKKTLQDQYINCLQYDKFRVKGIRSPTIVSSFKLKKLSKYIKQQLHNIQLIIQEEQDQNKMNKTKSGFDQTKMILEMKMKESKKNQDNQQVRNKIREAQLQFEKELAHAVATKGDYKLKSAVDYEVPQTQRLNLSRKKKHLFLHYQYIFQEKKEFNKRLDLLRKKKRAMIEKLDTVNRVIAEINYQLNIQEEPIEINIDEEIQAQQTDFTVTEQEMNQYLIMRQKEKDANKKTSGMGMANKEVEQEKKQKTIKIKQKQKKHVYKFKPKLVTQVKRTPLQQEMYQIKCIKLQSEKKKISSSIQNQINQFETQLEQLRINKYHLQNNLQLIQMKLLVFGQQLLIFRDMQSEDNALITQLVLQNSEKQNLETMFINLTQEIADVQTGNQDIKKKFQEEKKILKQFVFPDNDEMREKIIKYYKIKERKRISKLKKQAEQSEKSESEQDQDQQQKEEEEESEDEFSDDQEKPDVTVIENDHKNFERIRKICQYDEKIQQNSKKKNQLEKQRTQINNKIKNLLNTLNNAQKQLKAFQKKKMIKINQVNVSLPIKLSQIQYTVKMNDKVKLQQDFTNAILFTKTSFKKLEDRIQQLERQKIDIYKKQKNLNKKLDKLWQQVDKASLTIESKRKQYQEKQLLKFGCTFQIEKLKELEPAKQVLQLREIYKKQERQVTNKIEKIKETLQEKKRILLEAKKRNTKIITEITQLGQKQNSLKKTLDSTNKQLFKNYDASKKDQLDKERQNLKDLIKFLSKEVDDLKMQIGLFKRKGGHIYTMVTSNKRNFS